MNRMLGIFIDIVLPIIIILIAIILSILLGRLLKKKYCKPVDHSHKAGSNPQVKLKTKYCTEDEMKFLNALHKALPRDCIAFPHVGISKLIEPKGNLTDYKSIVDKYVDICVFLRKDMKPILIIDLFNPSPVAQQLKKFDEDMTAILKAVKIPVLHKQIQDLYNIEDLTIEALNAMDSTTVAYIKNKSIGISDN